MDQFRNFLCQPNMSASQIANLADRVARIEARLSPQPDISIGQALGLYFGTIVVFGAVVYFLPKYL